ncbi:MAG TPA: tetratricopeptide repeat protein [Candidatus Kapabacteria bacterium]|nr:tetratricopeptide repeat protein [Candidatus Kapabacteria bacterium]
MKKLLLPEPTMIDRNPLKAIDIATRILETTPDSDHLQKVRCLSIIGNSLKDTTDNVTAAKALLKGLQEAVLSNNPRAEAVMYNALGTASSNTGDSTQAIEYYSKSRTLASSIDEQEIYGITTMHLAIQHIQAGEYKAGLVLLLEILLLTDLEKLRSRRSFVYANISFLYQTINDYENALVYKLKAAEALTDTEPSVSKAVIASGLGMSYLGVNDTERALPHFFEQLSIAKKLGLPTHKAMALHGISKVYLMQGQFDRSEKTGLEALGLFKETQYRLGEFHCTYHQALIHHKKNHHKEACSYLKQSILLSEKAKWDGIIGPLYNEIAEVFEIAEDTKNSSKYYRRYIDFEEQFNTFKSRNELLQIHQRFEQQGIQRETDKKELQTLQYTLEQQRNVLQRIKQEVSSSSTHDSSIVSSITTLLDKKTEWQFVETQLSYEDIEFSKRLVAKFPTLTRTEIKICQLLKLGWSTKSISQLLCISPLTVDKHRSSIRTKLKIQQKTGLQGFLLNI